ncbi:DUF5959 family protein [Streptomyces sp. NBC_00102]|uniref:DUF5959 family protein n=1 Tax=Streptomyces sp. NBC_00102 TaxID=2975652 RepID=UPI00224FA214|nr:DUF5959 family protein [Streptomyces sp. NBC_00102]MCX5399184.1 DUF5959 family protein [Streptomyces sp. NBC_00102]
MTQPAPVDLIHLPGPDGERCVVRVTGRSVPGALTGHDILCAEVLLSAGFADARLDFHLLPVDLDSWERELSGLVPGGTASLGGDGELGLGIHVHEDGGWLSIEVDAPDRMTVLWGTRPHEGWIAEHRERLEQVRRVWPREVVETSPGAYAWSPGRKR